MPALEPQDELNQLLKQQVAAIEVGIDSLGGRKVIAGLVAAYLAIGGDLAISRRIVQVAVDIAVTEELQNADLPGPDAIKPYIVPTIREVVASLVGKKFDQLTASASHE